MTKRKIQDKPKFEIKKRIPKEKPDFFQNLTPFSHPVAEILNFHKEESDSITLIEAEVKEELFRETDKVDSLEALDPLDHLNKTDHLVSLDRLEPLATQFLRNSESLLRQSVKNSNYPVSPAKDFAKLPNSIRRAVQHGDFPGHSLQIYLYLYSLTRGAIQPKRAVRTTKPKIKVGAGVGSDVTLNKHLNHLKTKGYLKITEIRGQYLGNEYEVIIPEEFHQDPLDLLHTLEGLDDLKTEGLEGLKAGPSRPFQTVENKGINAENKTFFKERGENLRTDDDPFADFYKKFQAASESLTGKKLSKNDAVNLSKLADLLILELNIAARRTGNISSIPAFLTEVLRRRLREVPLINNKSAKVFGIDRVGQAEPESYEIKALDEKKREAALSELREFAEDSMLEDFKKWYTSEDWEWLKKELEKSIG